MNTLLSAPVSIFQILPMYGNGGWIYPRRWTIPLPDPYTVDPIRRRMGPNVAG
jgi:hypothetical protein